MAEASRPTLRSRLAAGFLWASAAQALRQFIQILVEISLTRALPPSAFGLVAMALVFSSFAAVLAELGIGSAIIQIKEIDRVTMSTAFWLNLAFGLVVAIAIWRIAPSIALFYHQPELVSLLTPLACAALLSSLSAPAAAVLRREMRFASVAVAESCAQIFAGAVALAAAWRDLGVTSLILQATALAGARWIALSFAAKWLPDLRFSVPAARELLRYGAPLAGSNALNFWVRQADNLLIGRYLGPEALGLYSRAYQLLLWPLAQISNVASSVLLPALARLQDDIAAFRRLYLRAIGLIGLVTLPICLGLLAVAEPFVAAALGSRWLPIVPLVRIFALLGAVQSIAATTGVIFQAMGRTDVLMRWILLSATLMIGSICAGIAEGSAIAVAVCYSLTSGLLLLYPAFSIPGKLIEMDFMDVVHEVQGIAGCALFMLCVTTAGDMLAFAQLQSPLRLACVVSGGVLAYLVALEVARPDPYCWLRDWFKGLATMRRAS